MAEVQETRPMIEQQLASLSPFCMIGGNQDANMEHQHSALYFLRTALSLEIRLSHCQRQ
jgi:hypothetical protein